MLYNNVRSFSRGFTSWRVFNSRARAKIGVWTFLFSRAALVEVGWKAGPLYLKSSTKNKTKQKKRKRKPPRVYCPGFWWFGHPPSSRNEYPFDFCSTCKQGDRKQATAGKSWRSGKGKATLMQWRYTGLFHNLILDGNCALWGGYRVRYYKFLQQRGHMQVWIDEQTNIRVIRKIRCI